MPTTDNNQRLAVLVKNTPSATLHLIVGKSERKMVFFACEQAALDDVSEPRSSFTLSRLRYAKIHSEGAAE